MLACQLVLAEPSPLPKRYRGQASTAWPTEEKTGQRIFPSHPPPPVDIRSPEAQQT